MHLGRTKTSGSENDDVVYLTGRPVEALNAWMTAARIDSGSIFRKIDRWGNLSRHALEPGAINAILKQRVVMAGLEPGEFPPATTYGIHRRRHRASARASSGARFFGEASGWPGAS